jgi:hypothetical protein
VNAGRFDLLDPRFHIDTILHGNEPISLDWSVRSIRAVSLGRVGTWTMLIGTPVTIENCVRAGAVAVTGSERQAPFAMLSVLISLLLTLRGIVRSRAALHLEVLALRHQLRVFQPSRRHDCASRTRTDGSGPGCRARHGWRAALVIVKPETVIAWHRQGFRLYWTWKSRRRTGRPTVDVDVRTLIRTMVDANPALGSATSSRRAGEIGTGGVSGERREIHASPVHSAVANLAHVPRESRPPDRGRRLLRRADRHLPAAV